MNHDVLIGKGSSGQFLHGRYANRHGLVAGATGTGKTVTLQVLAEGFSRLGVPVFAADIKGDLSGLAAAGSGSEKLAARAQQLGMTDYVPAALPVQFWDVFGRAGTPLRATVTDMGPELLARLLDLNDTQTAVMLLVFRYADDHGLLLLDLKDLKALLNHVTEHAAQLGSDYGLVSKATAGAIQRALLGLESAGGDAFFGEPAVELADLMRQDGAGRGVIGILDATQLIQQPRLYATVLLWLMAELFEELPEVGDPEVPKLVFFFDEAHLLFRDAPKVLVEKVEQVVRLIRSKGVGIYFVTQNPLDLPDVVLGQLGNRVQHALRAFTPRDQKAVRAAAQTFRANPDLDTETVIGELGVGEALVSTLQEKGVPSPVERTLICPPTSRIGPLSDEERRVVIAASPLAARYTTAIDRESAYELLLARHEKAEAAAEAERNRALKAEEWQRQVDDAWGPGPKRGRSTGSTRRRTSSSSGRGDSVLEAAAKSMARSASSSVGREIGRQLLRGILGAIRR